MLIHIVQACFISLWTFSLAWRNQDICKRSKACWNALLIYILVNGQQPRGEGGLLLFLLLFFGTTWSCLLPQWVYKLTQMRRLCFPLSASSYDSSQNFLTDLRRKSNDTALVPERWSCLKRSREVSSRWKRQPHPFFCSTLGTYSFSPPCQSHLYRTNVYWELALVGLGCHNDAAQTGQLQHQTFIFSQFLEARHLRSRSQ